MEKMLFVHLNVVLSLEEGYTRFLTNDFKEKFLKSKIKINDNTGVNTRILLNI